MGGVGPAGRGRRLGRLGLLGFVVAAAVVGGYFGLERTPKVVLLRWTVVLLAGLEAAYWVALAASLVGVPVLAALVVRGRRRQNSRPRAARWLLLGVSVLLALGMGEATVAAVRGWRGRGSAVPPGGLARNQRVRPWKLPGPVAGVELPTEFRDRKPSDGIEIVVLGESSAAGVPYSLFGLSPGVLVQWQLERIFPGRAIHVTILACMGDTLEGQHRALAGLTRKPDVLLVYCGHNEFSARLPEGRDLAYYVDADEPTPWARIVARAEGVSPLCGLVRSAADACRVAIPPPREGHRQLVDTPAYTREEYDALLGDFRRRLGRIVAYAVGVGALPVLVVPPGNDSDFEPSRSSLPPETRRAAREAFAAEVRGARGLEATDPEAATRAYRALIARFPGFAETHYRLARLREAAGDRDEAYRHDVAARDLDGLPIRCPTEFQNVYREVAARYGGVLVDGQACFHAVGRHGLLDDDLFHDAMHPSLRGQLALAQAVLSALRARRAFGWPDGVPVPVLDPGETARRFGLGPAQWSKLCHWGIMSYDLTAPARFDTSERRAKQDAFGKAADRIDAGTPPGAVGLPNIGVPEPVPLWSPDRDTPVDPGPRR